jgi:pimeloyl-ACP methyl ester carboxylesterase
MGKGTVTSRQVEVEPRVRRGYFECRYGQLHIHNAIPPGGGFEEGTPLICLHNIPGTGRLFERFMALSGRDRSVYAPDIPGFGESDPPQTRPLIGDYAAALGDFLDTMRFRQVDLLGYQAGALIAAELAVSRAKQVRRLIMASIPILNDTERDTFRRVPWSVSPTEDGAHLQAEWRRTLEAFGRRVPPEIATRAFAEKLKSGIHGAWMVTAVQHYPVRDRLPLITQSTLVLRPKDEFWEATPRIRELLPKARCVDLPEQGYGFFDTSPDIAADCIKEFLRS